MKKVISKSTHAMLWSVLFVLGCSSGTNFSGGGKLGVAKEEDDKETSADSEAGDGGTGSSWDEFGADGAAGFSEQSFAIEGSLGLVDVFFAFDTSPSMNDEKASLEMNMKSFLDELEKQKVDYRVTAIGNDFVFPVGLPPTKFAVVPEKVSSNNAISRVNKVFEAEDAPLPLPLRDGAKVELIIVTDDEGIGSGNLAVDFKSPPGKTTVVDSIVGLQAGNDAVNPACSIVAVGQQYINLSNMTKGKIFNLCDALKDFNAVLKQISQQIVISTRGFTLEQTLDAGKSFLVKLNDQVLPSDKVTYDSKTNKILLASDVPVKPGDKVIVRYFKQS